MNINLRTSTRRMIQEPPAATEAWSFIEWLRIGRYTDYTIDCHIRRLLFVMPRLSPGSSPPIFRDTELVSVFGRERRPRSRFFNFADPAMEDSLYDSESMRRFAGIELLEDAVPDESTILRFRHLLEEHRLSEQIFALVRGLLESKRLLLKSGTIVDATIIDVPPSTKNEARARDPEMKSGKKNTREWHFGMKRMWARIGAASCIPW
jgi:hypothetical protein